MTRIRRWAIFVPSVISDIGNPSADLYRALGRHLTQSGREAIFYEQRANAWLRAMLLTRGASALRQFREEHAQIEYRTYELREGAEHVEWLTRVLSTADVALVDRRAPAPILTWVGQLTRRHLQTFIIDPGPAESLTDETRTAVPAYSSIVALGGDAANAYQGESGAGRIHTLVAEDSSDWLIIARELANRIEADATTERE